MSWVHSLGWALLHCLWQFSCLALCYHAVEPFLLNRPRARYGIGLGALVLAPLLLLGTYHAQSRTTYTMETARQGDSVVGTRTVLRSDANASDALAAVAERHLGAVVLLWMAGGGLMVRGFTRAYARCRELNDAATPLTSRTVSDCVRRSASRMKLQRFVDVAESPDADSPLLVGWFRPRIILPVDLERAMTTEQIQAIVDHELAHVARRDYPVNLVQSGIERLLFFHPAVMWLSRQIRVAREHCCDDLAAAASEGGPLCYARALVRLEEVRRAPATALGVADSDLVARVRRLVAPDATDSQRSRWSFAHAFVAFALAALLLLGGAGIARTSMASMTVLRGLDPVHLVAGDEVPGSPAHSVSADGYRYLFADADTMERFRRAPERYSVRNADFCPITGDQVRPDAWGVVDGQIVLFCCTRVTDPLLKQAQRVLSAHAR